MPLSRFTSLLVLTAAVLAPIAAAPRPAPKVTPVPSTGFGRRDEPLSLEEARRTVSLLHDVYLTTLRHVHRRFPVSAGQPVVAALVIRDIQKELSSRGPVRSRFLAVDTRAMNPDHNPKDDFEREAVSALRRGSSRVEAIDGDQLRVATTVSLGGDCFPCHATEKNEPGRAAISWTAPLRTDG